MSSENTDNMEKKQEESSCLKKIIYAMFIFVMLTITSRLDMWLSAIIWVVVIVIVAIIERANKESKSEEVEGSTVREFISVNDMTCVDLVANHALVLLVYYDSKSSGDLFRMLKELQNACVDDIAIGFYDISDKDNTKGVADNDIRMTPTFILYRNGAESQTEVGPRSAEQLLEMIQGEY